MAVLLLGLGAEATEATHRSRGNPIRKVVNMLKMMEQKVAEEGEKKKELFDKYMCYCKTSSKDLKSSISAAQDKVPQLKSTLEEATANHKQLVTAVEQHKTDRESSKQALEGAMALRKKQKEAFDRESTSLKANIAALRSAIAAVEKGKSGFLQTSTGSVLKQLSLSLDMSGADRDVLASFLSQGQESEDGSEYAPQSGEILGILKQMGDEMDQQLTDITAQESSAKATSESLVVAKRKEIAAATAAIEEKTGRAGELAVQKATVANELEDTTEGLAEDKKFLAQLNAACEQKKAEWQLFGKTLAEEKVALAETVKMLSEDDALDLFKKTLARNQPPASFLQVEDSGKSAKKKARAVLKKARRKDRRIVFLELALRGQKKGFDQVLAKVDALVTDLKKEQQTDDDKKEFCNKEIDKTEDELKVADRKVKDVRTFISDTKEALQEVRAAIGALVAGIQALDREVQEATANRKKEHAQSMEELAANNAAKSLLELAKNRLHKFYNPKLYKAPPKQELTRMNRIATNFGAGASLAEVSRHGEAEGDGQEARPPPPPEVDLGYIKKAEESGGVMAMLDLLRADLEKQITETETEEKNAQKMYEALMKRSVAKRALDAKAVGDKETVKAELEAKLHSFNEDLQVQLKSAEVTTQELMNLHKECDWLVKNHGARKEARADEVDSLQKAKAVLSGASYS